LPDDPEVRVVACTKNNIGKKLRSFTFRIDPLPDTKKSKNRSKFSWGEFVDLTADDIVSVAPIKNKETETAVKWLRDQLEDKERIEKSRLEKMGNARSYTPKVLERAAMQLGVITTTRGEGRARQTFWSMPTDETPNTSESHGRKHLQKSKVRSIKF
jgi:hypothetical protein